MITLQYSTTMKHILALLLYALFVAYQAGARTLYVDASRPNNKGNALKAKTAKKTIQAAINIAKKGDTIVVLPGYYTSIKTKNIKITIKAAKGSGQTFIQKGPGKTTKTGYVASSDEYIADLGTWESNQRAYDRNAKLYRQYQRLKKLKGGTSTVLSGFTLGNGGATVAFSGIVVDSPERISAVAGGTLKSCVIADCHSAYGFCAYSRPGAGSKAIEINGSPNIYKAKLVGCSVQACKGVAQWYSKPEHGLGICASTLTRCHVFGNGELPEYDGDPALPFLVHDSKFYNCLLAENKLMKTDNCVFANCTIADNPSFTMKSTKAYNTIFHKVAASQFNAKKNKLTKCYKGSAPNFVSVKTTKTVKVEVGYWDDWDEKIWDGTQYRYYTMVDAPGNYHLAKGSPCIDKGTKAKAVKKLFGSKDLDGKKRIKGKSVDIGCYEY